MANFRRLKDKDIERVCELLDCWPAESVLTWDLLVTASIGPLGFKTTRQALERRPRIKDAYRLAKERARITRKSQGITTGSVRLLRDRLERFEAKCERLEQENHRLLNQFRIWAYNAEAHGLGEEDLNRPLPPIDREKTKWRPDD